MLNSSFYGGLPGISLKIVKRYDDFQEMLDDFSKGYECDVLFGQLVIIDSHNTDKYHGNIYERGYDWSNSLNGAIYIGNLKGATGGVSNLLFERSLENVIENIDNNEYDESYSNIETESDQGINMIKSTEWIDSNIDKENLYAEKSITQSDFDNGVYYFRFKNNPNSENSDYTYIKFISNNLINFGDEQKALTLAVIDDAGSAYKNIRVITNDSDNPIQTIGVLENLGNTISDILNKYSYYKLADTKNRYYRLTTPIPKLWYEYNNGEYRQYLYIRNNNLEMINCAINHVIYDVGVTYYLLLSDIDEFDITTSKYPYAADVISLYKKQNNELQWAMGTKKNYNYIPLTSSTAPDDWGCSNTFATLVTSGSETYVDVVFTINNGSISPSYSNDGRYYRKKLIDSSTDIAIEIPDITLDLNLDVDSSLSSGYISRDDDYTKLNYQSHTLHLPSLGGTVVKPGSEEPNLKNHGDIWLVLKNSSKYNVNTGAKKIFNSINTIKFNDLNYYPNSRGVLDINLKETGIVKKIQILKDNTILPSEYNDLEVIDNVIKINGINSLRYPTEKYYIDNSQNGIYFVPNEGNDTIELKNKYISDNKLLKLGLYEWIISRTAGLTVNDEDSSKHTTNIISFNFQKSSTDVYHNYTTNDTLIDENGNLQLYPGTYIIDTNIYWDSSKNPGLDTGYYFASYTSDINSTPMYINVGGNYLTNINYHHKISSIKGLSNSEKWIQLFSNIIHVNGTTPKLYKLLVMYQSENTDLSTITNLNNINIDVKIQIAQIGDAISSNFGDIPNSDPESESISGS